MAVGVLALQGAFIEHERMLGRLGQTCVELRDASDLQVGFDRLVLPGGESTVQLKLLRERGMLEPLRERIADGMPVLGTCAGLILLASEVVGGEVAFGTIDCRVRRNAYGRQLASFHATAPLAGIGDVPMTFIRAPYVEEVGDGTQVLATVDDRIVAVRCGSQLGLAFHPELDADTRLHELFLAL
ncbi:MAG: pyridoxal 5'-phosphate synthase glutaminase subunit PdxT [Tractidigestivibacter sp.]|jgi:5'-phosphate synthase pdxT subunit|uniref:pyridoxal 5'-phosphate synthase glutaminase subunit PdxT n=1 Tax=Tractidigestivibacter sp. TaxID=2847320 RepID=UPI003D8CF466